MGLLLSTLIHVAAYGVVRSLPPLPSVDIAFELPSEVEIGFQDAPTNQGAPAVTPRAVVQASAKAGPPAPQPEPKPIEAAPPPDPAPDPDPKTMVPPAQVADAGTPPPDASTHADAVVAVDAGTRDAGAGRGDAGPPVDAAVPAARGLAHRDSGPGARTTAVGAMREGVPGASVDLTLNLASLRGSPLEADARRLLAAIPDWQQLLAGSGVDPIRDLDRLRVASPDLSRTRTVVRGEYRAPGMAREAVARLSAARGKLAHFRRRGAIEVAPWANADRTARVIALTGRRRFIICRPEDLPGVLAADSLRHTADAGAAPDPLGTDEAELLRLRASGLRTVARGGDLRMLPVDLGASVRLDATGIEVRLRGTYPDADQAASAQRFWSDLRDRMARHALASLLGLSAPLKAAQLAARERDLIAGGALGHARVRGILAFVGRSLAPPPPPPPIPAATKPAAAEPPPAPGAVPE